MGLSWEMTRQYREASGYLKVWILRLSPIQPHWREDAGHAMQDVMLKAQSPSAPDAWKGTVRVTAAKKKHAVKPNVTLPRKLPGTVTHAIAVV